MTGVELPELLRASHIKPWRLASDEERLDVHNGLLLAVHLDAMFDAGFLTFDESGRGIWSPRLDRATRGRFALGDAEISINRLTDGHQWYLAFHRRVVYR